MEESESGSGHQSTQNLIMPKVEEGREFEDKDEKTEENVVREGRIIVAED